MPALRLLARPLVQRQFIPAMLTAGLIWFWPVYSFTCKLCLITVRYRTQATGCVCTSRSAACRVMASAVGTICTASLTFASSTFCPHSVLMCFVWIWEQTRSLISVDTRVGTLIVATIYLQLIQNRYMFRSSTVLHCSHQHCVNPLPAMWKS